MATLADGVLAGASVDRAVVQLPARHTIGARAYSAFSVAHEMQGRGLIWYPGLGIGPALLTLASAAAGLAMGLPFQRALPISVAACLAVLHSLTTARAAPLNLRQRGAANDEAALSALLDSFTRWHNARAAFQLATFAPWYGRSRSITNGSVDMGDGHSSGHALAPQIGVQPYRLPELPLSHLMLVGGASIGAPPTGLRPR